MPPKKATAGRWSSAVTSPEREQTSFGSGSSGFELDHPSVHLRTSLQGTIFPLDPVDVEQRWIGGQPIEDQNDKSGEIVRGGGSTNPRSFPHSVKQQCWEKADKVKGRDPDRWRRDPLGNIIFRKLVGCPGCLCHDYDHIVPYSKIGNPRWRPVAILAASGAALVRSSALHLILCFEGGKSTLDNCQVLQATVNRSKGNHAQMSKSDLIQKSAYCRVSGRDVDLLELSAYGNVRRGQDSGGCNIQ